MNHVKEEVEEVRSLPKPEIRKSDRPNIMRCREFSLPSIPSCLYGGEGGASGRSALLNSLQSITR